jgi:hypothetical protein
VPAIKTTIPRFPLAAPFRVAFPEICPVGVRHISAAVTSLPADTVTPVVTAFSRELWLLAYTV